MSAQPAPEHENVIPLRPGQPDTPHPWERPPQRRPVIPGWMAEPETRKSAVTWAARHAAHHVAFHAVRLPKYLTRTAACAPRGLMLAVYHGWRWVFDREGHELRVHAVATRDQKAYATMARIRKDRVRTRLLGLATGAAAVALLAGIVALIWAPGLWVLFAAATGVLAYLGRPRNAPLIDHAVVSAAAERITPDVIVRALDKLGLAGITAAIKAGPGAISFIAPGVGRDGPGWRAELDLPYGVTAVDVMDRRDRLASGLRRPLACVWPEPAHDQHAGRLVLYILDRPLRDTKAAAWPLAEKGAADLFRPAPFARDQRGRAVTVLLMFASMLIGAMPRQGKTMALRILGLYCALDPSAQVRAWELKGTGDLSCLEHVAHSYGSGADDATLEACLADVREVAAELDKRAAKIRSLPRDVCPENKVTPELAARRSLRPVPARARSSASARRHSATRSWARNSTGWSRRSSSAARRSA